jgi:hypothetical protein
MELDQDEMPGIVSRMAVDDDEKRSRAGTLVESLRSQASRWDGFVFSEARE